MKKRIDVMVDIETLGTKANATIFQIAAVAFDIETGIEILKFNQIADIEKNENPLVVDGSTLKWWLHTDKELLHKLLNSGNLSSEEVLLIFADWLEALDEQGDLHLWGNGILFDNNMIKAQLEALGLNYPVHFTRDRDVRTIIDLASAKANMTPGAFKAQFNDKTLVAHDAFDDVRYQIRVVTYAYNFLMNGGTEHV